MSIKKKVFILATVAIMLCISLSNCSSCERMSKDWGSDVNGGLNRIVNVYDFTGNKIATYEGKIDVQQNESKVLFELDGKRYVYYNALVEVIEK